MWCRCTPGSRVHTGRDALCATGTSPLLIVSPNLVRMRLMILRMQAKCARSAFGATRTSENVSIFSPMTKAPKFTNAPERGAVNATKPSEATAFKGASDNPTKKYSVSYPAKRCCVPTGKLTYPCCQMCQRTSFFSSKIIYKVPQQGTKSYIATLVSVSFCFYSLG